MSEFVRIAGRNEKAGATLFQSLHVERSARCDDDFSGDLRLGYETIAVVGVDCRIDPGIERGEFFRRFIEEQPVDVVARSVNARHRLFDEANDRFASIRRNRVAAAFRPPTATEILLAAIRWAEARSTEILRRLASIRRAEARRSIEILHGLGQIRNG